MIRIRQVGKTKILRRSLFEVELVSDPPGISWRKKSTLPVTLIDRRIGVAEAWSLVHAAEAAWERGGREWIHYDA